MREIWKDIDGFPGYKISNFGRVKGKRVDYVKWCFAPGSEYPKVTLSNNGKYVDKRINILVATAFLPNPNNYPIVMHMDNNPQNNRVDNLKWGTYSENAQYMYDCNRHRRSPLRRTIEMGNEARMVAVIAINMNTGEELSFISQHEASRKLGVSQQHIWGVLNGWRRSAGGYYFKYADVDREKARSPHRYPKRIKPIKAICMRDASEYIFKTKQEASEELGVSYYIITKILNGQMKQSRGYSFEYIEEDGYYGRNN